jgi:hypothetical protein
MDVERVFRIVRTCWTSFFPLTPNTHRRGKHHLDGTVMSQKAEKPFDKPRRQSSGAEHSWDQNQNE